GLNHAARIPIETHSIGTRAIPKKEEGSLEGKKKFQAKNEKNKIQAPPLRVTRYRVKLAPVTETRVCAGWKNTAPRARAARPIPWSHLASPRPSRTNKMLAWEEGANRYWSCSLLCVVRSS